MAPQWPVCSGQPQSVTVVFQPTLVQHVTLVRTSCTIHNPPLGGKLNQEILCHQYVCDVGSCCVKLSCFTGRLRYLVVKNSTSLLVFSSMLLETIRSSTSWLISGRLVTLPPRLRLDDVEEELRPESGTGDAWHSRKNSKQPPE